MICSPYCVMERRYSRENNIHNGDYHLYDAVIRGLNQLSDVGWESNSEETIGQVEVEIFQEPTRHVVNIPKLLKWINEKSVYPGDETRKEKLRKILNGR
jgi:hypothetical protein